MGRNDFPKKGQIIAQLVDIHSTMMSLPVSGYGGIYLKRDLPGTHHLPISHNPNLTDYCLAPLLDRSWWNDERASISIDRGPCNYSLIIAYYRDAIDGSIKRDFVTYGSNRDAHGKEELPHFVTT